MRTTTQNRIKAALPRAAIQDFTPELKRYLTYMESVVSELQRVTKLQDTEIQKLQSQVNQK